MKCFGEVKGRAPMSNRLDFGGDIHHEPDPGIFTGFFIYYCDYYRQTNLNRLTVPRCRLSTYGCRLFIMLARQSGTRCQMNLAILTASIVLNGF